MIILLLILGLMLRLINLNQSLWLDEAISALAARDFSYYGIIFDFLKIDNHPPLFYLLLRLWGQIFGFIDFNLRFLPVLLGSALVLIIYKIAFNVEKNKAVAIIAGVFAATSPLLIYYSQEVRMYILITLFCAIEIFIYQSILKKETLFKWVLFSVTICLLFFSDYITVFFFPVLILYPVITKNFRLLKKIILSFIPLLILFIFWYPYFSSQLLVNQNLVNIFPGWQNVIGGATFKNLVVFWMKIILGRISFQPKLLYYGLVGIFSVPVIISLFVAFKNLRKNLLIWLWLSVPLISGFLFSFLIPVFNYFRFIFVLPALLILCSLSITKLKLKFQYLLLGLILTGNIIGLAIYYLDPSQQRENWKQAVDFIEKNAGKKDVVLFEFHEPFAPFRWYSSNKIDAAGGTDSYFAQRDATFKKMDKILTNKNGVYYFEYLRDLTDPQKIVEQKLEEKGFKKNKIINDFYNIGQVTIWTR